MASELFPPEVMFAKLLRRVDYLCHVTRLSSHRVEIESHISKGTILWLRRGSGTTYATVYKLNTYLDEQEALIAQKERK